MHRRFQFGMRENPASNRRHGSRAVVQEHLSASRSGHGSHPQEVLLGPDSLQVGNTTAESFATGERREEAAESTAIADAIKVSVNAQASAGAERRAGPKARHVASDAEFEPLLDVAEAARLLRIHPKTLRAKAGQGIIPGIQIGRVWRFRASMLNRWLEEITGDDRR
jgi:excisionase family DNA binding protein